MNQRDLQIGMVGWLQLRNGNACGFEIPGHIFPEGQYSENDRPEVSFY